MKMYAIFISNCKDCVLFLQVREYYINMYASCIWYKLDKHVCSPDLLRRNTILKDW